MNIEHDLNTIFNKAMTECLEAICSYLKPIQKLLVENESEFKEIHVVFKENSFYCPFESNHHNYDFVLVFVRREESSIGNYNFLDSGFDYCYEEQGDIKNVSTCFSKNALKVVKDSNVCDLNAIHHFFANKICIEQYNGFVITKENIIHNFKY